MQLRESADRDGYAIVEDVINEDSCEDLVRALNDLPSIASTRRQGGRRNLFAALPALSEFVRVSPLRTLAEGALGPGCFAVRALLFDKTPDSNWLVKWHQDVTIAVRERADVSGYGPWSVKEGVLHVRPPVRILEQMLALRLHLDPCGSECGPLRVIPASHNAGLLPASDVPTRRQEGPVVECTVGKGGVVLMRPLLLHSSPPARSPSRRRVLHLEYAAVDLDGPLEWHERH